MSTVPQRSAPPVALKRACPQPDPRPRRGVPVLWSPAEVTWLQRHFARANARLLRARFADRCFADVYLMARSLGLAWVDTEPVRELRDFEPQRLGLSTWTLEELREARVMCRRGVTLNEFKQILGRSRRQVRKVLMYMGCSPVHPPHWTPEQDARLAQAFAAGGREHAIASQATGRLDEDVHWRLVLLGLVRGKEKLDQLWETRYLRLAIAAHRPIDEMSLCLQATPAALLARARELECPEDDIEACPARTADRGGRPRPA